MRLVTLAISFLLVGCTELGHPDITPSRLNPPDNRLNQLYQFFQAEGSPAPKRFASVCLELERPYLMAAIAAVESNGRTHVVSNKGAKGAWQVMERYHGTVPWDLEGQAKQAENIVRDLIDKNGDDIHGVLREYYGGPRYKNTRDAKIYADKVLRKFQEVKS